MKKILQVVSSLALGGTEAFIMNNYRYLDRNQYQFDFLVFTKDEYPYVEEIEQLGGHVYFACVPNICNAKEFVNIFSDVVDVHGPYHVVHSHVNISNSWVMYAAKKKNIPIRISHSHDTGLKGTNVIKNLYTSYRKYMIKKYATRYVACSKLAGDYLYGSGFFVKNGLILKNGIDVERFVNVTDEQKNKLRLEFRIEEGDIVFGNITRFEEKKNTMFTLALFKRILEIESKAKLILGGPDGGLLARAKDFVKQNNIEENVIFIGNRNDMHVCLGIISVYIFPSKYEGLPFNLLEAQASGCHCICADNISREIDVGAGLVDYIPIDNVENVDVVDIVSKSYKKRGCNTKAFFENTGYDIQETHKMVIEIYNGK